MAILDRFTIPVRGMCEDLSGNLLSADFPPFQLASSAAFEAGLSYSASVTLTPSPWPLQRCFDYDFDPFDNELLSGGDP